MGAARRRASIQCPSASRRASSARAGRLEAAVEAYRGRAAAAGALRRWVRALEERHAGQMRRANALQLQLGRAQAGRAQLEAARRQVGGAWGGGGATGSECSERRGGGGWSLGRGRGYR